MSDFYLLLLAVSCALTFTESEKHVKSVESGTVTVEKFKWIQINERYARKVSLIAKWKAIQEDSLKLLLLSLIKIDDIKIFQR